MEVFGSGGGTGEFRAGVPKGVSLAPVADVRDLPQPAP